MGCSFTVEVTSLSEIAQVGAEREFTAQERRAFKRLVTKWGDGECAIDCHTSAGCPYVRWTSSATEYLGYANLHDLLYRLYDKAELGRLHSIPEASRLDAMSAQWARQPGHFGG